MDANWMALISAFSGGIANLMARRLVRFAPARDLVSFNFALMAVMLLPAAPWFWSFEANWQSIGIFALAALVDAAANIFYFESFEVLPAVTASSILALSPLFSLLLWPWLAPEAALSGGNALGIGLAVVGLVLLARNGQDEVTVGRGSPRKIVKFTYPLLAALLFGINIYPVRMLFVNGWTNPYTYYLLRAPVIAAAAWLVLRPNFGWVDAKKVGVTAGRLIFVIGQWLLLLAALEVGNPAVVKVLADTSPLFVLLLAGLVLKEKVGKLQALGAALTVAGMALAVM